MTVQHFEEYKKATLCFLEGVGSKGMKKKQTTHLGALLLPFLCFIFLEGVFYPLLGALRPNTL